MGEETESKKKVILVPMRYETQRKRYFFNLTNFRHICICFVPQLFFKMPFKPVKLVPKLVQKGRTVKKD